jgi:hypothetical protein
MYTILPTLEIPASCQATFSVFLKLNFSPKLGLLGVAKINFITVFLQNLNVYAVLKRVNPRFRGRNVWN